MIPVQITLSSYALIGLALTILSSVIVAYIQASSRETKSRRELVLFFAAVACSGITVILTNAFVFWGRVFDPWQDFWVLAGGIALTRFGYDFPRQERSRERTAVLALMSVIALVALVYCIGFDVYFLSDSSSAPQLSDTYYLLLPLGTFLIVSVFLRRSLQLSRTRLQDAGDARAKMSWRLLYRPIGKEARALRNLALALSLAFLPGLQTLVNLPAPYGVALTNIGSLLAVSTIALVYFSTNSHIGSFLWRLVGTALATILLIICFVATIDVYRFSEDYDDTSHSIVSTIRAELVQAGVLAPPPDRVAYVLAWSAAAPDDSTTYRTIFLRDGGAGESPGFYSDKIHQQNARGYLEQNAVPAYGLDTFIQDNNVRFIARGLIHPAGAAAYRDHHGYVFQDGNIVYEVGLSHMAKLAVVSNVTVTWMSVIVACTLIVLLVFSYLFRWALLQPLEAVLDGIRRLDSGDLGAAVPVYFNDEVGLVAHAFNNLSQSLKRSAARQEELLAQLQASHGELESRVADRTREIAAFADLSRLSSREESLSQALEPALTRIVESSLCEAVSIHMLSEDGKQLELVAQRNLPAGATTELASVPLVEPMTSRMRSSQSASNETPLLVSPPELYLPALPSYLGHVVDVGDQNLGLIGFYRGEAKGFQPSETALLVALARQVGLIASNHYLRHRIADIATTEERQRLARDLHDSATQLLYGVVLLSRASADALEEGSVAQLRENLEELQLASIRALRELRSLVFELQPLSIAEVGLEQALRLRFASVESRVGIEVDYQSSIQALPPTVERELYFVIIEALNNVLKHADASRISLSVRQAGSEAIVRISDNGCGFEPDQSGGGHGLANMRQRVANLVGAFSIKSAPEAGTEIVARIPLPQTE